MLLSSAREGALLTHWGGRMFCGTSVIFGAPLPALMRMRLSFVGIPVRLSGVWFGVGGLELAHALAFELDLVGVVDDAIEDGVGKSVDHR
jgi:hypothetical protein